MQQAFLGKRMASSPSSREEPVFKKARCREGHRRENGRWEGRHRPTSAIRLDHSLPEIANAYRGYDQKSKLHRYEFLDYFDTMQEKDAFVKAKRELFKRAKLAPAILKRKETFAAHPFAVNPVIYALRPVVAPDLVVLSMLSYPLVPNPLPPQNDVRYPFLPTPQRQQQPRQLKSTRSVARPVSR